MFSNIGDLRSSIMFSESLKLKPPTKKGLIRFFQEIQTLKRIPNFKHNCYQRSTLLLVINYLHCTYPLTTWVKLSSFKVSRQGLTNVIYCRETYRHRLTYYLIQTFWDSSKELVIRQHPLEPASTYLAVILKTLGNTYQLHIQYLLPSS